LKVSTLEWQIIWHLNFLKEELGDVLMWLLTLANLLDVDMEEVITEYLSNPRKLPSK